ncbi:MAG TPA: proline--tRNA ligase [Gaiellales bacterium]|jgi:prolyl-tRNA synthetase|nr:proline--tRNA ligase [Gaiellales bacterium]
MSRLPDIETDFPAWYAEVVRGAELAEHSSVRGSMVIRPHGYAIWELLQRALDDRIKATGHENVYFPLLVPRSVMAREADLIEGFSPEVALVTEAGGSVLEEPLVVRPTSEATIWNTYAGWVQSYRDLPLLYNQWANVVRWELRPRLFLRTTEFLWQEGHTAHETEEEAIAECLLILEHVYADVQESVLAMPVLRGRKSPKERFAAARETFTTEAMMRDRKALQAGTSHYLGDEFARAYGVSYTGRDGQEHHPFAASWGASSRLVGGVIMTHGDERGLRLPPAVAPQQVVVVPIAGERSSVREAAEALASDLRARGVRVRVDGREHVRPGAKFFEWELKGAPLRLELGERDLAAGAVTVVRRDTGEREQTGLSEAIERVRVLLDEIQAGLLAEARAFRERHTSRFDERSAMMEFLRAGEGFAVAVWCGSAECEAEVKAETSATIRCLTLERDDPGAPCIVCGGAGTETATWAQAY